MNAPANPAIDSVEKIAAEMREAGNASNYRLNRWADRLAALAQTNDAGRGEPVHVATLHDDGHWVLNANHPDHTKHRHESDYAGWKLKVYVAPPSGAGEPKIYTKADAEALCAIAVAAATSGTYESNCERIEKRLMEHRLSYTHGDDGDAYPLVDRLVPDGETSIETGRKEIELLAENIADLFGKPEPPSGAAVREDELARQAIGWMYAWACTASNPRTVELPKVADECLRALSTQPRGGE